MLALPRLAPRVALAVALAAGCARAGGGPIVDELDTFGLHLGDLEQEVDSHAAEAGAAAGAIDEVELDYNAATRQRIGLLQDSLERIQRRSNDRRLGRVARLSEMVGRAQAEADRHLAASQACSSDEARSQEEKAHARKMDAVLDELWYQRERARSEEMRPTRPRAPPGSGITGKPHSGSR